MSCQVDTLQAVDSSITQQTYAGGRTSRLPHGTGGRAWLLIDSRLTANDKAWSTVQVSLRMTQRAATAAAVIAAAAAATGFAFRSPN